MGREKVRGRQLFERFLKGEPLPRPAFVPMIRGLLSRVEGVPMETLTSDPTLWANSLLKSTLLFGFDGVVVGTDFTLMAEACGCEVAWLDDRPNVMPPRGGLSESPEQSGRLRNALDTARRLFDICRSDLACVGALTGPVTLASQLFGEQAGPQLAGEVKHLMVRVVEAFCKTRPDALIFLEDRPLAGAGPTPGDRRIYNTLKNIASHYDVPAGLYLQGYSTEDLGEFSPLNMDIYILGPARNDPLPTVFDLWELGKGALGVGLGLPLDDPVKARGVIQEGLRLHRERPDPGLFFTSVGPVTRDVDIESLRELADEICRL